MMRRLFLAPLAASALFGFVAPARALDHLNIIKAGQGIVYAGVEVGLAEGFYKRYGLDVTGIQTPSAAAAIQAMTGGTGDISLQSGTTMGFTIKGAPQTAVATLSGPPYDFALGIDPKGPIKTVADLKGKSVGVTSSGSITWWFVRRLGIIEGWGPDGITAQPLGGTQPQFAALQHGDIAAMVTTPETAADYGLHGQMKVLLYFGDYLKTFQTHTIFASNKLIAEHPELVERFLKGWFTSVRYMVDPKNHAECVKIAADSIQISPAAAEVAYAKEMEGMSLDGAFDPEAVDIVRKSLPETGILPSVPDAKDLYTGRFVPVTLP